MNPVLVFPLILALTSCGQSHTEGIEQTDGSCYNLCPAGYHKVGNCDDQVKKYKCKKCEDGFYTDLENYIEKCLRCDFCNHDEVIIEHCTFNRSTVCGCKEGYYDSGLGDTRQCEKCECSDCPKNADYRAKCQPLSTTTSTNPTTTPPVFTTTVANKRSMPATVKPALASNAPLSTSKALTTSSNPNITEIPRNPWNSVVLLAVVIFVLLSWFLLICTMKIFKNKDSSSCWSKSKDAEVTQNEQPSHQGSNPTTLNLTLHEETPMLALSQNPAISEHPTHISPLVPVNGQIVARQNDHAERWPAIVLYAIIKEVPLHRWKEFLRLLKVADQQMVRVEMETGFSLGSMEKQYQMLRLWSQRSSSKLTDVFSALHYMELSGCAQLLQESLDQLQWTPDH